MYQGKRHSATEILRMVRSRIPKVLNRRLNRSGLRKCDMCHNMSILVEHHIRGRGIPNYNHPSNLTNVCSNCHMNIHSGKMIVEQWVMSTEGKFLSWHFAGEPGITGQDATPHQIGVKHAACTTQ